MYKLGYTTGVFDLFHIGHLNILRRAKEQCEYLIVGVSTDELVQSYKNKTPMIPFEERIQIVEAIKYVDEVVAQETLDKVVAFSRLKYDVLFQGDDWKGSPVYCETISKFEDFEEKNVKVILLPRTEGTSSTLLKDVLNKI